MLARQGLYARVHVWVREDASACSTWNDPHSTEAKTAQACRLLVIKKKSYAPIISKWCEAEAGWLESECGIKPDRSYPRFLVFVISNRWVDAGDPSRSSADSYAHLICECTKYKSNEITHVWQVTWSRDPGGTPADSRVRYFPPVDCGVSTARRLGRSPIFMLTANQPGQLTSTLCRRPIVWY